jgi:glycosyltransferase involved in cell wall biosynthesis
MTDLSVAIPIYNEEESIPVLCEKLHEVLSRLGRSYEIVLVDDGSKDRSWAVMREMAHKYPCLKLVRFRRNFGQTAAMAAGINESTGAVVVTMDADLQNDPKDIPAVLEKLEQTDETGRKWDVVSGWRKNRKDAFISRKLPSMLANKLIGKMTGVRLHDYGCSLKAYRREIISQVHLYGELHRFVPALCRLAGGTVAEIPVDHHAREFGRSKYGISRTFRVVLDLMLVKFLMSYSTRPIQIFGKLGLWFGFAAATIFGVVFCEGLCSTLGGSPWFGSGAGATILAKRPFWIVTPLMFLGFSIQLVVLGLLAELQTRTYHESQGKQIYSIEETVESDRKTFSGATGGESGAAGR